MARFDGDFIIVLSNFMQPLSWLTIGHYHGVIAVTQFDYQQFKANDYPRLAIPFPTALIRAVKSRQAEYLVSRYLIKKSLQRLAIEAPLPRYQPGNAPCWPTQFKGSISHSTNIAICAIEDNAHHGDIIGIDIEHLLDNQQVDSLWPFIISIEEKKRFKYEKFNYNQLVTLIFSAKESLFKALFPKVNRYFDFQAAHIIALNDQQKTFTLQLTTTLSPIYQQGCCFSGHYRYYKNAIITLIFN